MNNDPPGKQQFFTWMAIDQSNGYLYVVFYDRRAYATLMYFGASDPAEVLCPRTSKDGTGRPLLGQPGRHRAGCGGGRERHGRASPGPALPPAHDDRGDPLDFDYNGRPPVEFFGRGIDVEVAWPGGGTTVISGNSFATPQIAGICALILGKHPGLTPFEVKTILYMTASNVGGAR